MSKLAFDIGCNVGKYSEVLLANDYSVIAVDPNPYLFNPGPKNVTRVIAACSDKSGTIPFYFSNADTISTASIDWVKNSRFSKQYIWQQFEVSCLTIDMLVKQYGVPSHIKVDVEGYELQVLLGMSKRYSEICFEWAEEQGDMAVQCVEYLYSIGYSKFGFIFCDAYLARPQIFYSIDEFKSKFSYDKDRKELWGMIWSY